MTIEEAILNRLRQLLPDGQEEVLRFANKLPTSRAATVTGLTNLR